MIWPTYPADDVAGAYIAFANCGAKPASFVPASAPNLIRLKWIKGDRAMTATED
jgi:hypothetical protein